MKIFHTADWHLGRMLYGRSLLEEQAYFLRRTLLPRMEEEKPDLVIVAGDIYDRQIAPVEAITLFDHFLAEAAAIGVPVAVIAGNHDGAERMALGKDLLRRSGVYIATCLEDAAKPLLLEKDGERVQVFLLPYLDGSAVRDYFGDNSLRGESACMHRAVEMLRESFEENTTKILVSHCFVAGSQTSDSESGLWVGGSAAVSADLWADFDYVALGHLHRAQQAGPNGRYAGSPLKYSVDEQHHKKSFTVLEIRGGKLEARLEPVVPLHDVRRISGLFAQLTEQGEESPCADYVEIELLDPNPVLLAAERLRAFYPNLLAVTNRWVAENALSAPQDERRNRDSRTIFQSFLSDICQIEPSDDDRVWFDSLWKTLGTEEDI